MSLPVFFASPRRSRAIPTAARLYLIKAFLAVCALTLLLALPSHAQWQVQRPDGTPIQAGNNGFPLYTTQSGTTTSSYPPAIPPEIDTTPVPLVYDTYGRFDGSAFSFSAFNADMYSAHPGFYSFDDGSYLPDNGTLTADISANLEADWVWTGTGAPPDYLDLGVSTTGDSYAWRGIGTEDIVSAARANAAVSDSLGDAVSAAVETSNTTVYHPFSSQHLMRVPVIGGKARAVVTGKLVGQATNTIAYGTYDPDGSVATNGGAVVSSSGYLSGSVYQAGPPKSIMINGPMRGTQTYDGSQWTGRGDSRFDNWEVASSPNGTSPAPVGESAGDIFWSSGLLGGPWPDNYCYSGRDGLVCLLDRQWFWNTNPESDNDHTFDIRKLRTVRSHVDWPWNRFQFYQPHDFLEFCQNGPAPVEKHIWLHLTDTDTGVLHPEWNFDGTANYYITFHNEFELDGQPISSPVPYADNPWRLYRSATNGSTLQEDGGYDPNHPRPWSPGSVSTYVENSYGVSLDLPVGPEYTRNYGTAITQNVGDVDIPAYHIAVVYYRQPKVRYAFNMKHFSPDGRDIRGYDSSGNELPWRYTVDRPTGGFDDHAMVTYIAIFERGALLPDTIVTEPQR